MNGCALLLFLRHHDPPHKQNKGSSFSSPSDREIMVSEEEMAPARRKNTTGVDEAFKEEKERMNVTSYAQAKDNGVDTGVVKSMSK
jgi:hypothetical protein